MEVVPQPLTGDTLYPGFLVSLTSCSDSSKSHVQTPYYSILQVNLPVHLAITPASDGLNGPRGISEQHCGENLLIFFIYLTFLFFPESLSHGLLCYRPSRLPAGHVFSHPMKPCFIFEISIFCYSLGSFIVAHIETHSPALPIDNHRLLILESFHVAGGVVKNGLSRYGSPGFLA